MEENLFVEQSIEVRDSEHELVTRIYYPVKNDDGIYFCKFRVTYGKVITETSASSYWSYNAMINAFFAVGLVVRGVIKSKKIRLDLGGILFDNLFPLPENLLKYWDDCDHLFKPPFQE